MGRRAQKRQSPMLDAVVVAGLPVAAVVVDSWQEPEIVQRHSEGVGKKNTGVVEELVVMIVAANESSHKERWAPGVHLEKKKRTVEVRYVRGDRVRARTKGNSEAGVDC